MARRTTALPPPKRVRNAWQRKRDDALRDAGRTKADVHRLCITNLGLHRAPSIATVQAVLDGRFDNEDVETAFLRVIGQQFGTRKAWNDARLSFFPLDEPPFKSGS